MQRACLSNKLEKVSLSSEECLLTDLKWVLLGATSAPLGLCGRTRVTENEFEFGFIHDKSFFVASLA